MRFPTYLMLAAACCAAGVARAQSGPTLAAATDRGIYRSDANPAVYVEAKIVVPAAAGPDDRSVRNIAFVLDCSGSMAGEPIQAVRQAVSAALSTLAERDVVSVVLFGSEAQTLLQAGRRDAIADLDGLLARIEPAGGAALYDALNQGAAQLRRFAATSTVNHLVLITDGPATKGPRERDDFTRLAELFVGEGITLSAIGLGDGFEEDLLATLARIGNGRFRFAAQPNALGAALQAELLPLRVPVAREAELAIEFSHACDDIQPAGWEAPQVDGQTVTYRFPALFAGQDVSVLAGARLTVRSSSATAAVVRLRWNDVVTGEFHEAEKRLEVYFDMNTWASRKSINLSVLRTAVGAVISEGMQRAIEQLDKGDLRRAQRELRRARNEANDINYDIDDAEIAAKVRVLEAYMAEVQARGMNELDRKILRSGLYNQFDTPTEEPKGE